MCFVSHWCLAGLSSFGLTLLLPRHLTFLNYQIVCGMWYVVCEYASGILRTKQLRCFERTCCKISWLPFFALCCLFMCSACWWRSHARITNVCAVRSMPFEIHLRAARQRSVCSAHLQCLSPLPSCLVLLVPRVRDETTTSNTSSNSRAVN